ncbi:Asparaginyl-tRNA synthetase [Spironucleus salmonicida]|uniref:asparagine--tRNA ligase n=1 Tax=Spironucleus salmonicida TaxID=348837 RepID=V6LAQ9_9EUKA|nr:Asparaginyl-tRNA synthetase [Spironucleus salmonicida]|eukprot:EST41308.1 Asparaginyl-tRNA synthetase [Spironucleus salmonicida]
MSTYTEQYATEIAAELEAIKTMTEESGEPISKNKAKTLAKGVDIKYKKQFTAEKLANDESARKTQDAIFTLTEDVSLPAATCLKLNALVPTSRALLQGWCHRVRIQSSKLVFVTLRDGHGYCQVVLHGDCAKIGQKLVRETAILVKGELKSEEKAIGGFELSADYIEIIGTSEGDFENLLQANSGLEIRGKNRHIYHRFEKGSATIKLRNHILQLFREHFTSKDWTEVNPPTIVNTACEGGSSLFKLDYYGDTAYMTQSSQLYLESVIHAVGDVYCIAPSYRAEKANTRRHLAEFTHLETEHAFITFDDLLQNIEDMVCFVVNNMLTRHGELLKVVNPEPLQMLKQPFKRMSYEEAIVWLNERNILNDAGEAFKFGDDIAETQERKMIDEINEPVFLTKFPAQIKAFYMPKCKENQLLTDSVDLLVPTVGEIVGGSMRIPDIETTLKAYEKEGISVDDYYWYTDVRKYGAHPHGGCGLGLDRFVCWVLGIYNIRDSVLYPRTYGMLMP